MLKKLVFDQYNNYIIGPIRVLKSCGIKIKLNTKQLYG